MDFIPLKIPNKYHSAFLDTRDEPREHQQLASRLPGPAQRLRDHTVLQQGHTDGKCLIRMEIPGV